VVDATTVEKLAKAWLAEAKPLRSIALRSNRAGGRLSVCRECCAATDGSHQTCVYRG
jgi:hypothetical protein